MTKVVVKPSAAELRLHGNQYEAIVRELVNAGHDASLEEPEREERRDEPGGEASGPAPVDLLIHIAEYASDAVVGAIIAAVIRQFRRHPRRRGGSGVIYGPNGEILREFELPRRRDLGHEPGHGVA